MLSEHTPESKAIALITPLNNTITMFHISIGDFSYFIVLGRVDIHSLYVLIQNEGSSITVFFDEIKDISIDDDNETVNIVIR